MSLPSTRQPALERRLRLAGRPTRKNALDADVFIEIRPVSALAAPDQPPLANVKYTELAKQMAGRELAVYPEPPGHQDSSIRLNGFKFSNAGLTLPSGYPASLALGIEYKRFSDSWNAPFCTQGGMVEFSRVDPAG